MSKPNSFLQNCIVIVGESNVLTAADDTGAYLVDWSRRFQGQALAVLRPANTEQVAALARLCHTAGIAMVPQGGNTGLSGGATPDGARASVVVHLGRMKNIRRVDPVNNTITAEAGALLADVQEAAREAGRLFPLSLAAEGSCTIGGNLATNAGGTAVLRYGNIRQLCLGLEVVTPAGQIWDGLRALRKDNTGYSLKDLYIGSEGTLGFITATVLKLFPQSTASVTCLLSVPDVTSAIGLLHNAQHCLGEAVTAFELMSSAALDSLAQQMPDLHVPLVRPFAWTLLLEVSSADSHGQAQAQLEGLIEQALDQGQVVDAIVATSSQQARELWAIRESIPVAQARQGFALRYDLSFPISELARFIRDCDARLASTWPDVHTVVFGHVGDGNLHYNVRSSSPSPERPLAARRDAVDRIVYDLVQDRCGSISAEHGIGQAKCDELLQRKSPVEVGLMRSIKAALDPHGLMNPGKVLRADGAAASIA